MNRATIIALVLCVNVPLPAISAPSDIERAESLSQRTGRPILAVVGTNT